MPDRATTNTSAAARLRRTFAYPTDDPPTASLADEQEQDAIIAALSAQDAASTALFRRLVLAVPELGLAWAALVLLSGSSSSSSGAALAWLGAVASLALSVLVAWDIPASSDADAVAAEAVARGVGMPAGARAGWGGALEWVRQRAADLNAGLCGLLAVWLVWTLGSEDARESGVSASWGAGLAVVAFGVVAFARRELRPVDVESLRDLKYDLKGA